MRTPPRQRTARRFRLSPLITAFACAFGTQAALADNILVNVGGDPSELGIGQISLRTAIMSANTLPCASHTITFSGPFTIGVSSPLPAITCANVEINAGTNAVIIDGSGLFSSGCGLMASSASTRIVGLEVRNFSYGGSSFGLCGTLEAVNNNIHGNSKGLFLQGSSVINGNQIHGNQYYGIYDSGGGSTIVDNDIYSNTWDGIYLANGGTVGGATPALGNRIYDNSRDIVAEDNVESDTLAIRNNLIGTPDGTTASGSDSGIALYNQHRPYVIADNVVVAQSQHGISIEGSTATGTISGNTVGGAGSLGNDFGIFVEDSYGGALTISDNVVAGNSVGIRLDYVRNVTINNNTVGGAGTLGNSWVGLFAGCSDDLTITANRVVGNGGDGMGLYDGISNSIIRDNLVGTPNGAADQGNGGAGIWLDGGECFGLAQQSVLDATPKAAKVLGGANNLLEGNTVAFNNDNGVVIFGTGNAIRGSTSPSPHGGFHSNGGKAINLSYYGGTPSNSGQASPVLTSAQASGGNTVINLTLASLPSTTFAIDLYANIEPQPATPDGRNYLGQVSVTTDGSGNGNATVTFTGAHNYIVATATGPNGTSELSQAIVTAAANEGQLPLPAGIDLGTTTLHGSPLVSPLAITNTGNANVNFTAISATPPFEVSHNCPPSLAPGAACSASISFPPLAYGNTTGQLTVASDAAGGNRVITLLASVSGVEYRISPASFSFGLVPVGSESPTRTFVITNGGGHAIPLSGVAVTSPFTLASSTCGARLAPGSSCTAEVAFAPTQPGTAEGTLTAQVDLPGAPPARSRLSGNGTLAAALALPSAIDFGPIVLGTPSVSQSVAIRNTGNAELTFSTSLSGPFALSGDCGPSLQPSASCNLVITFTPSEVGEFAGALAVASNAPGGSRTIPIAARVQTAPHPEIRLSVTSLEFDGRMIGTSSAARRVTVTNIGGVMAQLGITPPTRDFIATSQCGATLAPGASCTTDVVFKPLAVGLRANRLEVTSDAPGSPFGVDLLGKGCAPPRSRRAPSCN